MADDLQARLRENADLYGTEHCPGVWLLEREAADQIDALEEEERISCAVIDQLALILAGIAIALKGEQLPLRRHSFDDLAQLAQTKMLAIELLNYQVGALRQDSARFDLFFSTVLADFHDQALSPGQCRLKAAFEADPEPRSLEQIRALIDATLADQP